MKLWDFDAVRESRVRFDRCIRYRKGIAQVWRLWWVLTRVVFACDIVLENASSALAGLPSITSIDPRPLYGSSLAQKITINGSNFQFGCKILLRDKSRNEGPWTLMPATNSTTSRLSVSVNFTLATADWTSEVINPDLTTSGEFMVHVQAPKIVPSVLAVLPNPFPAVEGLQYMMIEGHNFEKGCMVTLSDKRTGEVFPPLRPQHLVLPHQIVIAVKLTATPSTWSVEVVNPTGDSSGALSFKVVDPKTLGMVPFFHRRSVPAALVGVASLIVLAFGYWRLRRMSASQLALVRGARSEAQGAFYRDLHDGVSSELAKVRLQVEKARVVTQGPPSESQANELQSVLGSISEAARNAKNNVEDLMWTVGEHSDTLNALVTRLRSRTAEFETATGVKTERSFPAPGPDRAVSAEFCKQLLLVLNEALNNVAKHSGGTCATVCVSDSGGKLKLTVADNGRGLSNPDVLHVGRGMRNMRQRVEQILGGSFEVKPGPPGMEIIVEAPLVGKP